MSHKGIHNPFFEIKHKTIPPFLTNNKKYVKKTDSESDTGKYQLRAHAG